MAGSEFPAGGGRTTRLWPAVVGVVALAIVAGVVATLVLTTDDAVETQVAGRGGTDDGADDARADVADDAAVDRVQLQPVSYRSDRPFTESVVTADDDELEELARRAGSASADTSRPEVDGSTSLLYGTRRSEPVCDVQRLVELLTRDRAVTAAWSDAAGVPADAVAPTVGEMTPVVLLRDTAVTNHVYDAGGASSFPSILQAGTPVLIDGAGTPRVQCSCGNPLLPAGDVDPDDVIGEAWDGFDSDAVTTVQPAAEPTETIEAVDIETSEPVEVPTSRTLTLDGLLVGDQDGLHVVDDEGVRRTVLDEPVEQAFDDGHGGLVYTLRASDRDEDPFDGLPPEDPDEAVVWHLPAGETEAVELVGVDGPDRWNRLLGAGRIGERSYAVVAHLVPEEHDVDPVATGPVVAHDLGTGEETVLLELGFGWEVMTDSVSFGGGHLALESGYSEPDWYLFDEQLQPVSNACSSQEGDGGDTRPYDADPCPWRGALDPEGRLTYLASSVASADGGPNEESELLRMDLTTGEVGEPTPVLTATRTVESSSDVVQVGEEHAVLEQRLEDGDHGPLGLLELATGEVGMPDEVASGAVDVLRLLSAPLVRPVETSVRGGDDGDDADEAVEEPAADPTSSIDPMNVLLPGGACGSLDEPAGPPIQLQDGNGVRGDDPMEEGFLIVDNLTVGQDRVDVDGDGTRELLVSPVCSLGGTSYNTPLVALGVDADGKVVIVGQVLDQYGRGGRSISSIAAGTDGSVVVSGGEWTEEDAMCCPSSIYSAEWRLGPGGWEELTR